MQLANANPSTDPSFNALLLSVAAPTANGIGLTAEARAAFPDFDSFLAGPADEGAAPLAGVPTEPGSGANAGTDGIVPAKNNTKPIANGSGRGSKICTADPKTHSRLGEQANDEILALALCSVASDLPVAPAQDLGFIPDEPEWNLAATAQDRGDDVAAAADDAFRPEPKAAGAGARGGEQLWTAGKIVLSHAWRGVAGTSREGTPAASAESNAPEGAVEPLTLWRPVVSPISIPNSPMGEDTPAKAELGLPVVAPTSSEPADGPDVAMAELPLIRPEERKRPVSELRPVLASVPSRVGAEFAVAPSFRSGTPENRKAGATKTFLRSGGEEVAQLNGILGIAVAELGLTMTSRSSTSQPESPASDRALQAPSIPGDLAGMVDGTNSEGVELPPASTAQEAVEVVLRTTEQMSARDQKYVRLQFSVGDARLDVHVELHANEVRTQFRTDSAELREALSHEWQSVATQSAHGDHGLRLAPAIFSAGEQAAFGAFSGDASSRRRESREAQGRGPRAVASLGGGRTVAAAVSISPRGLRLAPPTSQHLHTLA